MRTKTIMTCILFISLMISSCIFPTDETSSLNFSIINRSNYIICVNGFGPKNDVIVQPSDTLFSSKVFDRDDIGNNQQKLKYYLRHLNKDICIQRKNKDGEDVGDEIIYSPPMYKGEMGENNFYNINSWGTMVRQSSVYPAFYFK